MGIEGEATREILRSDYKNFLYQARATWKEECLSFSKEQPASDWVGWGLGFRTIE